MSLIADPFYISFWWKRVKDREESEMFSEGFLIWDLTLVYCLWLPFSLSFTVALNSFKVYLLNFFMKLDDEIFTLSLKTYLFYRMPGSVLKWMTYLDSGLRASWVCLFTTPERRWDLMAKSVHTFYTCHFWSDSEYCLITSACRCCHSDQQDSCCRYKLWPVLFLWGRWEGGKTQIL